MFPNMVNDKMNKNLVEEVTKEELEKTVQSFQKGKSLGPDGFTIEFYQGFYELL